MNYLNMNSEKLLPTVKELNILLADFNLYYQKLRNYHWNVVGENFFTLHNKFEELYNDSKLKIDAIAERILTLQFHPVSRFSDYLDISNINESVSLISDREMIEELVKDHSLLISQMKKVIDHAQKTNDEGTIDLMSAYVSDIEKNSWMLTAWLKQRVEA